MTVNLAGARRSVGRDVVILAGIGPDNKPRALSADSSGKLIVPAQSLAEILHVRLENDQTIGYATLDNILFDTRVSDPKALFDLQFGATVTLSSGLTTASTSDTSAMRVGSQIVGDGIPAGTTIASITDTATFEMSHAATTDGDTSATIGTGQITFRESGIYQLLLGFQWNFGPPINSFYQISLNINGNWYAQFVTANPVYQPTGGDQPIGDSYSFPIAFNAGDTLFIGVFQYNPVDGTNPEQSLIGNSADTTYLKLYK